MEITSQHPWHAMLLTQLSAVQVASPLMEEDPQWEYIDGQMMKLGSLAHSTLNIDEIQQQLIGMLAQKSKDFRLMVHLLRTLQHGGNPENLMLAVSLLARFVQNFWSVAWPQNAVHRGRFARQILKRFESAGESFSQQATDEQRDNMQGLLAQLAQAWHHDAPELGQEIDGLRTRYARIPERRIKPELPDQQESSLAHTTAISPVNAAVSAEFSIDNSNDKAWRQTLLKMADILCNLQPDVAIGFCLRRHAVWGAITALPAAKSDGRTPLAAVSADRIADYLARIATADISLWQQVEQSLTLAPYWLDGHALSAQIASRLGYDVVAHAIRDELWAFLERLPGLRALSFSDMTPFLSSESAAWLQPQAGEQRGYSHVQDEIWQCYQQQGLEAALNMLDKQPQSEPRAQFYNQLLSAQLLENAGMTALARQQYNTLLQAAQQLQLSEWEPALIALLTEKQRQ